MRPHRVSIRLSCATLLLAVSCSPAAAREHFRAAPFDHAVRAAMAEWQQPGLGVAVVERDGPVFVKGYGVRAAGADAPVDADTLFGIGSCTKPFAAATVALLVDQGRIGWDDRVTDRLPWFRASDPWVTRALTVRDLLSNRSGLRSQAIRAAAPDRRSYLSAIARSAPAHDFRANYSYSFDMFTLAGELVAAASGESWADFARRTLWRPLGMTRTNADYRVARDRPDAARPHQFVDGVLRPIAWIYEDDIALPSGGMNSSVRDLSSWLAFQLGAAPAGGPAISARSLAETRLAHIPLRGPFDDSPFRGVLGVTDEAYALGWFTMRYRGERVYYHHGSQDGFRCFTAIAPDLGLGFAALANSPNAGLPRALFLTMMDQAAGRPAEPWSGRLLARQREIVAGIDAAEAALRAARGTPVPPSLAMTAYAGEYSDGGPIGPVTVTERGGALTLAVGRMAYDLRPWTRERFEMIPRRDWPVPREHFLEFRIDPAGRVAALAIDGAGLERTR